MTDGANRRPTAGDCLPGEELLPVTTKACVMIWKVRNVGKISFCGPGRRDFMTGVAGEALVLFGRMKKGRVPGSGSLRSLRLRRRFRRTAPLASLRGSQRDCASSED